MNFQNYTTKSQEAVQSAMERAADLNHQAITPLHLLLVLVQQEDSVVPLIIQKLGSQPLLHCSIASLL